MTTKISNPKFIIVSLPRCGSTSLANLLSCHKDIRCIIEPCHPGRYGGKFFEIAMRQSITVMLERIWTSWNGIKHICESNGWPFQAKPELNDALMLCPDVTIIFMVRRNLLRRVVSNFISRQTRFWMGTRSEFHARLQLTRLRPLDPALVRKQITLDKHMVFHALQLLTRYGVKFKPVFYEDFFCEELGEQDRVQMLNNLLKMIGFSPITLVDFRKNWLQYFDPNVNKFSSTEVYRYIPEIDKVEEQVGCLETGWLFR